jgi:hypothetical protein
MLPLKVLHFSIEIAQYRIRMGQKTHSCGHPGLC